MKDLQKLVTECEKDLLSVGIRHGNVTKYSINTRAKKRWGQCKQIADGVFEINISQQLLQDNITDQAAKDTILHEMLHTVDGCMGHKGKWKELAAKVNKELPQYTIKRTTSSAEKGIVEPPQQGYTVLKPAIKKTKKNKTLLFLLKQLGIPIKRK